MFELNVGTTPCQLSQKDYRKLAEKTEGYVIDCIWIMYSKCSLLAPSTDTQEVISQSLFEMR